MNEALKKLCWNCDGNVAMYEVRCPYCTVSLTKRESDGTKNEVDEGTYQSYLSSNSEPQEMEYSQEIPEPPYAYGDENLELKDDLIQAEDPLTSVEKSNSLLPLILLLPGSSLFVLGLALFLFSHNGALTFQFESKYWFFYLFAALPLMYFGWKALSPKEDREFE